ncbi:hypothetical protein KEJ27_04120 [Candidatus Bathyarchaeota archaeon]|nr:hypothetical protein [Candidatus Bathyarchaeota archaeon]
MNGVPIKGEILTLRPYKLLCLVCQIGEEGFTAREEKIKEILQTIRERPDIPIMLRCNAGDVFSYQDPGVDDDTPEGAEFNVKRDLEILQRMDLPPGCILPARIILHRVFERIPSVSEICTYDAVTSQEWKGCAKAKMGCYEKGRQKGIDAIIPPRSREEMRREKERSLEALYSAKEVTIRPHILMCAVCQYGGGVRPPYEPDNLPELLEMVLTKKPDIPIKLVRGADWMICAPCPTRVPELNACVNVAGHGGLSNQLRDLRVLQRLGLKYGDKMPARDLCLLIFEKIPTTKDVCALDNPKTSMWCDPCGEANLTKGREEYDKGRQMLMEKLKAFGEI